MLRRSYLPLAVLGLALLSTPSAVEAQLGGMLKKAAKAAATKAVEKQIGADEQGASNDADGANGARTTTDSLYAIVHPSSADVQSLDGGLLAQFFTGYTEERVLLKRDDDCTKKVYESAQWKAWQDAPQDSEADGKAIDAKMNAHMKKTCGVDLDELDVPRMRAMIAGAKASGLAPRRYAMVRERVLAFGAQTAKYNTSNYRGYKFSGAEKQALDARRADVMQLLDDERGR